MYLRVHFKQKICRFIAKENLDCGAYFIITLWPYYNPALLVSGISSFAAKIHCHQSKKCTSAFRRINNEGVDNR